MKAIIKDYKYTLRNHRHKKTGKPYTELLNQFQKIQDQLYEKEKQTWELLKEFYLTGNPEYYEKYRDSYNEAEMLNWKYKSLLRDIFL